MNIQFYSAIHRLVWWVGWIHFLFSSLFSRENCIWSPCFLFITAWLSLDTSGKTSSWISFVCSLVCFLMVGQYVHSHFIIMIISTSTLHFLMINVLQQQLLYFFTRSNNQLLNLNILSFIRLFYLSTRFLSVLALESFAIHWLTCFHVSGCFLCFSGCCECRLLCLSHVMCHTRRE